MCCCRLKGKPDNVALLQYLAPGVRVWLQSENGILGMGPYPTKDKLDA